MLNKETALRQIDDIYNIIQNNLKAVISGPLMIATGLGIMVIPAFEWLFSYTLDPFLSTFAYHAMVAFLLRTAFYWTSFYSLSKYFDLRNRKNPLIEKIFNGIGKFFPMVALSTAAALAFAGHASLISPIILILVGCLFLFFGQFSLPVVRLNAYNLIIAGIAGILLTTLNIPHLWMYLVIYEGLSFVIMGLALNRLNKPTID